jgi:ElaB/YqjD/DUF883 family membrane-anchored ribosome-binding protein
VLPFTEINHIMENERNPFPKSDDPMLGGHAAGSAAAETPSTVSSTSQRNAATGGNDGAATHQPEVLTRVVQGAHQTIDRIAESAAPHVARVEEGVAQASDALNSRANRLRETGEEWTETLRCTVRDNPLAAVGMALAVGMLIARLSR